MVALPVRFGDLEFRHQYVIRNGKRRWVAVGMPEIPKKIEDCCFFLFARTEKGMKGPVATGFFVSRSSIGGGPYAHTYAVTNAHAIPTGASIIRMTLFDGTSKIIDLEPHEWEFIDGGDDIAAADVTDYFEDEEWSSLNEGMFVTQRIAEDTLIGIGEDGFMLGLFADAPGSTVNAPVGRFGNLAALAKGDYKLEQPNGRYRPSYLFDMRSRTGFSGSPVFIYRTSASDITGHVTYVMNSTKFTSLPRKRIDRHFLLLLGIHCGQYPELVEFREHKKPSAESVTLSDGSKLRIPSGMTIVAPAWEITTLLNIKKFSDIRDQREAIFQALRDTSASPEAETIKEADVVDSNPNHKEDFMRLLSAAATTKPQDDQT